MRIGLIIYGGMETVSGGYRYDRMLVEYLRRQGDQVEILSLPQRGYLRCIGQNFSQPLYRRLAGGRWDLLVQDELNHPSLFIINALVRKKIGVPVVSIVHHLRSSEPQPSWQRRLLRGIEAQYLRSIDGCVFNSGTTRTAVQELLRHNIRSLVAYPGISREENGVNESSLRQRLRGFSALKLLFLGNVIRRKGLHVLINALTALRELPWHLDIVGDLSIDRGYVNSLLSTIVLRKLVDRVSFYGMLSDAEVSGLLTKTHLLAVPSFYEGLGIAYMEALSYGVPAIGTTGGGAREIIAHGENGYLVGAGDAAGLARVLLPLCRDPELLYSLSVNALRSSRRFPAWETSMAAIRTFFWREILRNPLPLRSSFNEAREKILIS